MIKENIGKVLWHSLDSDGSIELYDVKWPNGRVETDIPSIMLEGVKQLEHHHNENKVETPISERKYK